ncbi:Esterase/lipase superfamily enzyme [Flexibacter flexilis DSM 6793]|uniref:Esterase/lipase superfamily enzyme n=1 Tax=Flexibacter flexilis DSM 6793 TaxID=927664 RepID=A0A1I1J042_9BACT|nr:alpha/beta hydrolase-fold protein [Flexibacter flexilis]SFC38840.1 Esterase/lipase superfamily enzyme [Flexibacter flexilis DSM 6793]
MREEYLKWYSPAIGRETEMLVFGHGGYPVIVFPTSMGRYYQNKDFKLIESVQWFVDTGRVKIYCPDSIDTDSWYNKAIHPAHRAYNHTHYDRMILEEVVSRAQNETGYHKVAVAGCSFGAYHATNFGFRHPEMVGYIFNMGGAFDIKMQLDGYYDDTCYYNNPPDFVLGLQNPAIYEMGVVFGVGEHDFCLQANIQMSEILNRKGLNNWLDIRKGGNHDWPVWREMFPDYLAQIQS